MRSAMLSVLILSGTATVSLPAMVQPAMGQDEEPRHDRAPAIEIPLPVPHAIDRDDQDMRGSCDSETVTTENDRGESRTVRREHCD